MHCQVNDESLRPSQPHSGMGQDSTERTCGRQPGAASQLRQNGHSFAKQHFLGNVRHNVRTRAVLPRVRQDFDFRYST